MQPLAVKSLVVDGLLSCDKTVDAGGAFFPTVIIEVVNIDSLANAIYEITVMLAFGFRKFFITVQRLDVEYLCFAYPALSRCCA